MELIGFIISLVAVQIFGRKNLAAGLFTGSIMLILFYLHIGDGISIILSTILSIRIIILALAVGIIPVLGGVLEESGMIDRFVKEINIGEKNLLILAPTVVGLLPMPGGALLSAPLISASKGVKKNSSAAAINVWYRHIIHLIYPISPELIASTIIAGVNLYSAIFYMIPVFVIFMLTGYIFLLYRIKNRVKKKKHNLLVFKPMLIILTAPFLDITIRYIFKPDIKVISTLISVFTSFLLSLYLSKPGFKQLKNIIRKSKPHNYSMLIFSMFIFLEIFKKTQLPELISSLSISSLMFIFPAFILGFLTGRTQLPASVIFPAYITQYGSVSPIDFIIYYSAIFLGYIASPVHPCVTVSLEFFKTDIFAYLREIYPLLSANLLLLILLRLYI